MRILFPTGKWQNLFSKVVDYARRTITDKSVTYKLRTQQKINET